jgi:tryptophan halogenase
VKRVEQVVVVGTDAPAWMAAIAIQRALGATGVRVRVIELPSLLQPADCYQALPALDGFHDRIGLEDRLLFGMCKALPIAGQRFANWAGGAPPFIHGYDLEPAEARIDFTHFWTKGRQEGLRTEFEGFSLGATAAKAGRLPIPAKDASLRAALGYHIDARAYSALLRHVAPGCGIESRAGTVADVEIDGERIAAVILADGKRVEADLFVDASGPQAVLIGRMPGAEFESWREWLPCDRMLVASAKALRPYPAYSQISAFRQGWVGLFPLQDRTAVAAVYDGGQISDDELAGSLPVLAKLPIGGDAVVSDLRQGIRRRGWVGNCVAVGEAAFSLEPLDAVQLHSAHNCITQLMALFPVETGAFPEAESYDRAIRQVAGNLRDFQAAHYKLNRRFGEPLWDRCRDAAVPETLRRKLAIFSARGHVPLYDFETFLESSWASLFIGHGLTPESYDPRLDALPGQEQIGQVHRRLQDIVALVEAMPTPDEFLAGAVRQPTVEMSLDA